VGVATLILVVPLVQRFVKRMMKIRKERSKLTDERINLLSSMLQGIRVTKLNHYESKVEENVFAVRKQGMSLLWRELRMWGFVLSAAVVSPLIAFGVAFAFYALVESDNIITPSTAFTALLLFSILRFPINMTARLVGKLGQAFDASAHRIADFLDREGRSLTNDQAAARSLGIADSCVVDVKNGSFSIKAHSNILGLKPTNSSPCIDSSSPSTTVESESPSRGSPSTLRNLSLQVKRSEVVAVVGKIGSGKIKGLHYHKALL